MRPRIHVIAPAEFELACRNALADAGCEASFFLSPADWSQRSRGERPDLMLMAAEKVAAAPRAFADLRAQLVHPPVPMALLAPQGLAPEALERAWRAGADDCLDWPLSGADVRLRVRSLADAQATTPGTRPQQMMRTAGIAGGALRDQQHLADLLESCGIRAVLLQPEGTLSVGNARLDCLVFLAPADSDEWSADLAWARSVASRYQSAAMLPVVTAQLPAHVSNDQGLHVVPDGAPSEGIVQKVNAVVGPSERELRGAPRVPFFEALRFRGGAGEAWLRGYTLNLSEGGVFIKTLVPLAEGASLEVSFARGTSERPLLGTVAWTNRLSWNRPWRTLGMGVRFTEPLTDELRERLVAARERHGIL